MITKKQKEHLSAIVNGEENKEKGWALLDQRPTEEEAERILYEYIIQQANVADLENLSSMEDFPCVPIMLHAIEHWGYYDILRMFCIKNNYVNDYISICKATSKRKKYAILQLGVRKKYRDYTIEFE